MNLFAAEATQGIELPPLPFAGTPGSAVSQYGGRAFNFRWWRRGEVREIFRGFGRAAALCGQPRHLVNAFVSVKSNSNGVADPHLLGGFCRNTIDVDVSGFAGRGCLTTSFGEPDGPHPTIDPHCAHVVDRSKWNQKIFCMRRRRMTYRI